MGAVSDLVDRVAEAHRLRCWERLCPFSSTGRDYVVTRSLVPQCSGRGGWGYRNHFTRIGLIGELLGHFLIPEVRLLGGLGRPSTPMDGGTARGVLDFKTAIMWSCGPGEFRAAFSVHQTQRQPHALPLIFLSLDPSFLAVFRRREIRLPRDITEIVSHLNAAYAVPAQAFPRPAGTFIIPSSQSRQPHIRAIQLVFQYDPESLHRLGIEGLCHLRATYESPQTVRLVLDFLETLGDRLDPVDRDRYRLEPFRLLADAQAWSADVPLNGTVELAIALGRVADADRRIALRRDHEEREEANRRAVRSAAVTGELALALLGILVAAAGRLITAPEMRAYALRRDRCFPKDFGRAVGAVGIPVAHVGERGRSGAGPRRLTSEERTRIRTCLDGWLSAIRANSDHPLVMRVIRSLLRRAPEDPVARSSLTLMHDETDAA